MPPAVTRAMAERAPGALRYTDGYDSWAAATAAAGAYSESAILDQVRRATDDVVAGRAAMERDGVTFDHIEQRWPVAGALLWRASLDGGRLRVLDFGGSLGSSLRQVTPLLGGVDVTWGVVEQPTFVSAGRAYEDERLRFFETIDECCGAITPTVALLSSVLQYLPDPHAVIRAVLASGVDTIIIDRTPMTTLASDVPIVQHVPAQIYAASYPAWLLSHDLLLADTVGWTLVSEFPGIEPAGRTSGGRDFSWQGMLLTRDPS
jgi:putative methyltransferase (TIGR04325 family)